jgi:hypothetical protein
VAGEGGAGVRVRACPRGLEVKPSWRTRPRAERAHHSAHPAAAAAASSRRSRATRAPLPPRPSASRPALPALPAPRAATNNGGAAGRRARRARPQGRARQDQGAGRGVARSAEARCRPAPHHLRHAAPAQAELRANVFLEIERQAKALPGARGAGAGLVCACAWGGRGWRLASPPPPHHHHRHHHHHNNLPPPSLPTQRTPLQPRSRPTCGRTRARRR